MKQTINRYEFVDAFTRMGRKDNFSYEGLEALFNYIEELEEETGVETELDVIGLCCEFNEYESLEAFHKDYDEDDYPDMDSIMDNTTVIQIDDQSFIIQAF